MRKHRIQDRRASHGHHTKRWACQHLACPIAPSLCSCARSRCAPERPWPHPSPLAMELPPVLLLLLLLHLQGTDLHSDNQDGCSALVNAAWHCIMQLAYSWEKATKNAQAIAAFCKASFEHSALASRKSDDLRKSSEEEQHACSSWDSGSSCAVCCNFHHRWHCCDWWCSIGMCLHKRLIRYLGIS